MARFPVPSPRARSVLQVDGFFGVDYTSNPGDVAPGMSPHAPNMIRDVPGKVRKCMGYYQTGQYPGRINGVHRLLTGGRTQCFLHAGTALYPLGEDVPPSAGVPALPDPLFTGLADERSESWQFGEKLYLLDGSDLLVCDGKSVKRVSEEAYIPTLTIAKPPAGGGKEYEPLNLLQPAFTELFAAEADSTKFCMTFGGLDEDPVRAWLLNSEGGWTEQTEGTHFTVDRKSGVINFQKAPGVSPVSGEDNVKITARRTVNGYADRIRKCRFGVRFGVGGAADRLFLSGNPEHPNRDWFSGQNDPSYWPDTGYSVLGSARSAVMGYSIINNCLAAHKDPGETDRNVILRRGDLAENRPSFPIVNTLQGPGAIAPHSFCYLGAEPVFLTPLGLYAITPSDISGERYSQNRSWYINGALEREQGRENAVAFVYRDMCWLCLNGSAYILDGLQRIAPGRGEPYSTRQYACFHRTGLPARVLWEQGGALCFGTDDGRTCAFYTDPSDTASYTDCGRAIRAVWETPDLSGRSFYKNKTFRMLAVQLSSAVATGVTVSAQKRGVWQPVWQEKCQARYLSYGQMTYSKFTYSGDRTNKTLTAKLRLKRMDKLRLRFENREPGEPFGLMAYALEFTGGGRFRG